MTPSAKDITGIILAGGQSRRMGADKGLLRFRGKRLADHSIEAVKPLCNEILIIANNKSYHDFGYPVYEDLVSSKGPLAGILTGLTHSVTDLNIILSCDSPFVNTPMLGHLLNYAGEYDAVVPRYMDRMYPLTAVYRKQSCSILEKQLQNGELRVQDVIRKLNSKLVDLDPALPFLTTETFMNMNTQEDLLSVEGKTR